MINTIDSVKIEGKASAFGGMVYSVNYNIGVNREISSMTIRFISENKQYLEPVLEQFYKIQIGNIINSNFMAVEYSFEDSSQGKILVVEFWDKSYILDKYWIGLHKKMGNKNNNQNITGNLILLGREVSPCDVNQDGVVDQSDLDALAYDQTDPCELLCPNAQNDKEPVAQICQDREVYEIFDVVYHFGELLNAIKKYIPIKIIPKNINTFYTARHTGKLRDVLAAWCADLGWTFYWEDDKLNFIDVSKRPKIKFPILDNVISSTETKSIKGTVSRGSISYYGEAGIRAQQDCSSIEPFNLRCLSLFDLYGLYYKPSRFPTAITQSDEPVTTGGLAPALPPDPPIDDNSQHEYRDTDNAYGVPIESFETSVVCSYFSQDLRELYNLFNYYEITSSARANALVGKWMDRLGQLKIVKVFDKTINSTAYQNFLNGVVINGKKLFENDEITTFLQDGGYFVLGYCDLDLLQLQYQIEQRLAKEFFGIHWLRPYAGPYMGETPQIFPNGQYFGALASEIKDVPFSGFNHTYHSYVGKCLQSFIQKQRNNFREYGILRNTAPQSQQINKKIVKSLLYLSKPAVWSPIDVAVTDFKNFTEKKKNKLFKVVDLDCSLLPENIVSTEEVKKEDRKKLKLMIFYPDNKLTVLKDFDKNKAEHNFNIHPSSEPNGSQSTGLTSKNCVRYTIGGIQIFTPAGASVAFKLESSFVWKYRMPDIVEVGAPQYKVLVSNTTKNRGIISKHESVLIKYADIKDNCLNVEYTVRNINQSSVRYINKVTGPQCKLPDNLIERVHQDFNKNLDFSINDPFVSKTYRIAGSTINTTLNISKGLESLNISIGADGVFTDIKIGNSLFVPPSEDLILRKMEFEQDAYLKMNARPAPF